MTVLDRRRVLAALTAAAWPLGAQAQDTPVSDGARRAVTVPGTVARVFPAGPPAAIWLYTLAPELLLGWPRAIRPEEQAYLLPEIAARPEVGRLTGRGNTANLEAVLASKPDLILDVGSTDATYVSLADRVQYRCLQVRVWPAPTRFSQREPEPREKPLRERCDGPRRKVRIRLRGNRVSWSAKGHDPVRMAPGEFGLMQAAQHREAVLPGQGSQENKDRGGCLGVQARDRLVGQEHAAALNQSARNRDTLLLTTREAVSPLLRVCVQANPVESGKRIGPISWREPS